MNHLESPGNLRPGTIRIFIVEDDPMVLDLHQRFIETIPGFEVVGTAKDGEQALSGIRETHPHLVILDVFMPEMDGLEVLKRIRQLKMPSDVIMVTAAHESATVKESLRLGAVDYLIKPFRFERLKEALESYRKRMAHFGSPAVKQEDIDQFIVRNMHDQEGPEHHGAKSPSIDNDLPKGIQTSTLERVRLSLEEHADEPLSAEDVAEITGVSRITARRYLEYLVSLARAEIEPDYGSVGRPVNRYRLKKGL